MFHEYVMEIFHAHYKFSHEMPIHQNLLQKNCLETPLKTKNMPINKNENQFIEKMRIRKVFHPIMTLCRNLSHRLNQKLLQS